MTAIRFVAILLLSTALLAQEGNPQSEPSHGDLINQGLTAIREFNVDRISEAKKRELAGYIPAGQEATVVFMYSVRKIRQGEDQEFRVFDDVYPASVKVLQESGYARNVEYLQEEVRIEGTGSKLRQGAPSLPASSENPQINWITWSQWRNRSRDWETNHKKEVSIREDPNAIPQLDPEFVRQSQKLLEQSRDELRRRPDAQLAGVSDVLNAMDAHATGSSWSPKPGGILLSPEAAGKLGDGLTIDKVEYVTGSGQVKVTGKASVMGLDADLLATTLRLAFSSAEIPSFSLDPHELWGDEWEESRQKVGRELNDRLRVDPAFAAAFQRFGFEVKDSNGHVQRLAHLDQLDPELAAEVSSRAPMNMDLVFRPKWLKRTRLGEMLFIADQSIKELWHGASVWSMGPSRALRVGTHVAPMFWSEPNPSKELLVELLHRSIETSSLTRWWFTPGGSVVESGNVLDLSQVQPVLQTERIGGTGKATQEFDLGNGTKITHEIVLDPLASLMEKDDPWSKAVVEEVNRHFEDYSREIPEWEGLRQVFRAYVFAVWLVKHDPAMGQRLLAQLPSPRPPDKPLPAFWPDPQILVVRMSDGGGIELGEMGIVGGVGFERNLLRSLQGSVGLGSASGPMGTISNFPGAAGFTPNPIDDDVPATPEGYAAWKASLVKQRGYLWEWVSAGLTMAELWSLLGISFGLALVSFGYTRWKEKRPFTGFEAGAIAIDTIATTLVFVLLVLHPDNSGSHTAEFVGLWSVVISYGVVFLLGRRQGRIGFFAAAMVVVFIWTVFTPGLGEIWRGYFPLHLATPPLTAYHGAPLPTDVVYTLQGLSDNLTLGQAAEPRYAFYPILVLLLAVWFWFEVKLEQARVRSGA